MNLPASDSMLPKSSWLILASLACALSCTSEVTNEQRAEAELAGLRQLGAGVDLNDKGQATFVNLSRHSLTDDQLQCVAGLASLRQLWLYDTAITDRGLTHLRGLVDLEVLVLGKTRITDRGLFELSGLRNLQELYLYETGVSAYAVHRLQEALPFTVIVY